MLHGCTIGPMRPCLGHYLLPLPPAAAPAQHSAVLARASCSCQRQRLAPLGHWPSFQLTTSQDGRAQGAQQILPAGECSQQGWGRWLARRGVEEVHVAWPRVAACSDGCCWLGSGACSGGVGMAVVEPAHDTSRLAPGMRFSCSACQPLRPKPIACSWCAQSRGKRAIPRPLRAARAHLTPPPTPHPNPPCPCAGLRSVEDP